VQLVLAHELTPFGGEVRLVLGGDDIDGGAMYAVLIEEQTDDFMASGQARFGKAQGAAGGGRVGRGEQGTGEFHGSSGEWKTAGMIRPDAFICPSGQKKARRSGLVRGAVGDQSSLLNTPTSCSRLMNRL